MLVSNPVHVVSIIYGSIDPLRNAGKKIEFLEGCYYGNRIFLNNAKGPTNHHVKFEIF